MAISLTPLDARGGDRDRLFAFFARNRFPFDAEPALSEEQIRALIDSGGFDAPGTRAFWLVDSARRDADRQIGIATVSDWGAASPSFDMRLDGRARGRGLGAAALREIVRLVFTAMPEARRLQGSTREDNIAMRQTFVRCGFVKEAHLREFWPLPNGTPRAGVVYAILRRDWESGAMTPVRFDDLGY
ncbi:GNAT family N-acetyltransferase [Schaalia naturae]|jgi:RimJ/RimL family protein N-acetyltransferase|uniref:GNAT family N-acetyltransferase n=1 Tax=Schaalia naturae TaxID=635203 RepID=A0ABW2SP61_9ACTO